MHHATIALGLDFVKALAVTIGLRAYVKSAMATPVLHRCWSHSLACGMFSQELATACFYDGGTRLVRPVCRTTSAGSGYSPRIRWNTPTYWMSPLTICSTCCTANGNLFDIDHCEAGAWLAEQWKLRPELGVIAAHHEDPAAVDPGKNPNLLTIVRLTSRLADALDFSVVTTRDRGHLTEILRHLPEAARRCIIDV